MKAKDLMRYDFVYLDVIPREIQQVRNIDECLIYFMWDPKYYNYGDKEQMIEDINCAFESLDDFREQIITTLTCDSGED